MHVDCCNTEQAYCNSVIFGIFLYSIEKKNQNSQKFRQGQDPIIPSCCFSHKRTERAVNVNCYHSIIVHTIEIAITISGLYTEQRQESLPCPKLALQIALSVRKSKTNKFKSVNNIKLQLLTGFLLYAYCMSLCTAAQSRCNAKKIECL